MNGAVAGLLTLDMASMGESGLWAAITVTVGLAPWRTLTRRPAVTRWSAAWGWRLLGIAFASVTGGAAILQAIGLPATVATPVPLLLAIPAALLGIWAAVVRPGASTVTALDTAIAVSALLLMTWTWLLPGAMALDGSAGGGVLLTALTILLVAGLAATSAVRDPSSRLELSTLAAAMVVFAVALVVPDTGAGAALARQVWAGYVLVLVAVVRGQVLTPSSPGKAPRRPHGGTAVLGALVLVSLVVNAGVTDARGVPPHPVEGTLQAVLLLSIVGRMFVTSRSWRRTQVELERLAHTDPLTGLRNRAWLLPHLEAVLARTPAGGIGALLIDVDRLRAINDDHGRRVGDGVLVTVARRLVELCAPHPVVRFGGDEILVVADGGQDGHLALAESIRTALAGDVTIDGRTFAISVTVGVATAEPDAAAAALIRHADAALHRAKELGRDRVVAFDPQLRGASYRRLAIEHGLRQATVDGSLQVHYQPVVDARTGALVSVEGLLRWRSAQLGRVGPDEFIPLAEEIGAIVPIGAWVIEQVCADLAELDRVLGPGAVPRASINVSGVQLLTPGLLEQLRHAIAGAGLEVGRIALEVTESALLDPSGPAAAVLRALSDAGFELSVDDFGTGYAALSYLEAFPVDVLKVDRSFVRPLSSTGGQRDSLVPTLVRIAALLDLRLIAEGVEDIGQRDALVAMGCDLHQGYLHSRPIPLDALVGWVRTAVAT